MDPAGKLKAKLALFTNKPPSLQSISNQKTHEKALSSNFYVLCEIESGNYVKARILASKFAKELNTLKKKDESSFEYYIHFQNHDRRHDRWVSYHQLKKTKEHVKDESLKEENAKIKKYEENQGLSLQDIQIHENNTKIKLIPYIQINKFKSQTWYYSYFPPIFHHAECLYFCDFCLNYYETPKQLQDHSKNCPLYHPPGNQIYRDLQAKIAFFEIDGKRNPEYCSNLTTLAKLFLDHKVIGTNLAYFNFYILCEIVDKEYHIVGYFSKQKKSLVNYNLSCILILPFYQRKGFGKLMISFSYQLTLIEGKIGTPEKPLSDLGRKTYFSWWIQRIIQFMWKHEGQPYSMEKIQSETGMMIADIQWTLNEAKMLKKSQNQIILLTDKEYLKKIYQKNGKPAIQIDREKIHWVGQ